MMLLSHGRYTSSYGPIYVYTHALHPPAPNGDLACVARRRAARARSKARGCGSGTSASPAAARVAAIVAQAHAAGVTTVFVKSSDGSSNYWSQFSAAARRRTARGRAEGVRVAVRLRHEPRRRGRARRRGGRQRRRLPGDRRRGRVRRQVRRRADLHRRPAREDRRRLPARARLLPLRLLPRLLPLLRLPRPGRRPVQRAADVLEGHRHLGRHRLREHLHRQPHLRAADLPARADLRRRLDRRPAALPRGGRRLRRDRLVVLGLAGNDRNGLDHARRTARAADAA